MAHALHSISVEDVRYFFDDQFTTNNTIPTVNFDLTDTPVLQFAPSRQSEFKFPGGAVVDYILSNNDQRNKFSQSGFTNLEEIIHAMHMLEMWNKASQIYKEIKNSNLNTKRVCPCLVDEKETGILDKLSYIYSLMINLIPFPIVEGTRRVPRKLSRAMRRYSSWTNDTPKNAIVREGRNLLEDETKHIDGEVYRFIDGEEFQIIPELKDSETWNNYWKDQVTSHDSKEVQEQSIFNFAMYMYCKINFVE